MVVIVIIINIYNIQNKSFLSLRYIGTESILYIIIVAT